LSEQGLTGGSYTVASSPSTQVTAVTPKLLQAYEKGVA